MHELLFSSQIDYEKILGPMSVHVCAPLVPEAYFLVIFVIRMKRWIESTLDCWLKVIIIVRNP